jgi:alpha-galactosidase
MVVATGGYTTLELRVTDARNNSINYDHADWGAATLTCTAAGTGSYGSDRAWTASTNALGPVERDQSNGDQPTADGVVASVGGVFYVKAIGTHAASTVDLSAGGCERFTASVGIDGEVTSSAASVVFTVAADGTTIFTSPTVTLAGGPVAIDLNITGRSALRLSVTDSGNGNNSDHATWADARLLC